MKVAVAAIRVMLALLILPAYVTGQPEKLIVLTDKEVAYRGDTVWFFTYVMNEGKAVCNNLYVQVYSEQKVMMEEHIFQCVEGLATGQLVCPGLPGNYWIRMYTLSSNQVDLPLTVRPAGDGYLIKRPPPDSLTPAIPGGLLKIGRDDGGYFIEKLRPMVQYFSAVVSDTGQPLHLRDIRETRPDYYEVDTNALRFKFEVKGSGSLAGSKVNLIYEQNNQRDYYQVGLDSTQSLELENLAFFDSAGTLNFQLNSSKDPITLVPQQHPRQFQLPENCIVDTVQAPYVNLEGIAGVRALDTVTVHAAWQARHRRLHNMYINSDPRMIKFQMGNSTFSYDLDEEPAPKWLRQRVGSYLEDWQQPVITVHPVVFFVDGQEVPWEYAMNVDIGEVRYIELREGVYQGMNECTYLTIWLRRGEDARKIKGSLDYIRLRGYTHVLRWTTPDRYTKNWIPFTDAKKTYIASRSPFNLELVVFVNGQPYYLSAAVDQ